MLDHFSQGLDMGDPSPWGASMYLAVPVNALIIYFFGCWIFLNHSILIKVQRSYPSGIFGCLKFGCSKAEEN